MMFNKLSTASYLLLSIRACEGKTLLAIQPIGAGFNAEDNDLPLDIRPALGVEGCEKYGDDADKILNHFQIMFTQPKEDGPKKDLRVADAKSALVNRCQILYSEALCKSLVAEFFSAFPKEDSIFRPNKQFCNAADELVQLYVRHNEAQDQVQKSGVLTEEASVKKKKGCCILCTYFYYTKDLKKVFYDSAYKMRPIVPTMIKNAYLYFGSKFVQYLDETEASSDVADQWNRATALYWTECYAKMAAFYHGEPEGEFSVCGTTVATFGSLWFSIVGGVALQLPLFFKDIYVWATFYYFMLLKLILENMVMLVVLFQLTYVAVRFGFFNLKDVAVKFGFKKWGMKQSVVNKSD